jgi:hypothetical protein
MEMHEFSRAEEFENSYSFIANIYELGLDASMVEAFSPVFHALSIHFAMFIPTI